MGVGRYGLALASMLLASAAAADRARDQAIPPPVQDAWLLILGRLDAPTHPVLLAEACCKHCSKGKACGDSCISRAETCRVGAGCACD